MKKIITIHLVLFLNFIVKGQDLSADYYSFVMNMYNVNPAYTGKDKGISGILNARNQVMGFSDAPKNVMAGIRSGLNVNQGIGGRLVADNRGAFSLVKADATYSYTAAITETHLLSFGVSAGFLNKNFTVNKIENYEQLDQTDPTLSAGYFNATRFIAGAGLLYSWKNLEVSIASPHMVQATEPFNQYFHGTVQYTKKINESFTIVPWVFYQNIPVIKNVAGLYCKGSWKDKAWLQAGYHTSNTVNAAIGFNLEKFGVGYSFQFANKALKNVSSGTHQVAIFFNIARAKKSAFSSDETLEGIIKRLDNLTGKENMDAQALESEIQKIKAALTNKEMMNADPANAEQVAKQLQIIEEKIKELEKRYNK